MKRTDMAVLIEYIRLYVDHPAVDNALDALAGAVLDLGPTGEAVAARALNNLHAYSIETDARVAVHNLERLAFEDVSKC